MSKRMKIGIIIGAGLVLVTIVVVLVLSGRGTEVSQEPSPGLTPASSPSPEEHFHEEQSLEALRTKDNEVEENPILKALPHDTRYWSLSYQGVRDNKYVVEATVYVEKGENAKQTIERQKPYILRYVRGTGQVSGTYVIEYESRTVDSEGY